MNTTYRIPALLISLLFILLLVPKNSEAQYTGTYHQISPTPVEQTMIIRLADQANNEVTGEIITASPDGLNETVTPIENGKLAHRSETLKFSFKGEDYSADLIKDNEGNIKLLLYTPQATITLQKI